MISAKSQTVSVCNAALTTTTQACSIANGFQRVLPNKYWAHRAPYNPQPKTVANAKRETETAKKTRTQSPTTAEKPAMVRLKPASVP